LFFIINSSPYLFKNWMRANTWLCWNQYFCPSNSCAWFSSY